MKLIAHTNKETEEKSERSKFIELPLNGLDDYKVLFSYNIEDLSAIWEDIQPSNNIFLQTSYLSALEKYTPINMRLCFLVFRKKNQSTGLAVCQIQNFKS